MERRPDQLVLGHHRVGADYGRLLIAVLVSHDCYDGGTQAVSLRLPKGADVPEASRPAARVRLNAASFRAVEEARGILADLGDADRSSGAWCGGRRSGVHSVTTR
jgi:hypothetical protein